MSTAAAQSLTLQRAKVQPGWLLSLPYPVRNVLRRWRTSLGMVIGVGIALGVGMTGMATSSASIELYVADYRVSAADLYVVQNGGTLVPILPSDTAGAIKQSRGLIAQTRALPSVQGAVGAAIWSMEREREDGRRRDEPTQLVSVMGIDGDPTTIPGMLNLKQGRWVQRPNEVVVGTKLSKERNLLPGSTLRLNGRDFNVVGIGRVRGFGFGGDSMAFMDIVPFRQRVEIGDVLNIIAVDTSAPEVTAQRMKEVASVSTFDTPRLIALAQEANASGIVIISVVIVMTMVIAGLFVSNVLGRSVAERRLEFATLRAIGVPSRTILLTVGAEATLIGLLATAIGMAISLFLGWLMNTFAAPTIPVDSLYAPDLGLFVSVFAMALVLGVVSGIAPARQATRVDPVDVLREA
jgi:hypothetical protein